VVHRSSRACRIRCCGVRGKATLQRQRYTTSSRHRKHIARWLRSQTFTPSICIVRAKNQRKKEICRRERQGGRRWERRCGSAYAAAVQFEQGHKTRENRRGKWLTSLERPALTSILPGGHGRSATGDPRCISAGSAARRSATPYSAPAHGNLKMRRRGRANGGLERRAGGSVRLLGAAESGSSPNSESGVVTRILGQQLGIDQSVSFGDAR
jgi:hypothetical protein